MVFMMVKFSHYSRKRFMNFIDHQRTSQNGTAPFSRFKNARIYPLLKIRCPVQKVAGSGRKRCPGMKK
ncbi:hypothetical protein ACFELR_03885 [Heyndrickxia coagulans]|uniref:hypothetical protein n=1 Tax=Heyndrickxia coagulans TaxID=1398 RepID=UPI00048B89EB|nr:hypothetical protein [Heyndrickxia coagulans]AVD55639.1 hypothetical protein C3766_05630 [Heyndrickxia coagulans]